MQKHNYQGAATEQSFSKTAVPHDTQLLKEQLLTLKSIDELVEKYQSEGKLMDALQCMEKCLILRGHCFGLDSIEVYEACRSVGEMCNLLSMACIQQEKLDLALELLKKAEVLTERHPIVRAVTFNNMCCYFKRIGKLRTALSYAERAIAIEAKYLSHPEIRPADTHLNACTVLSELHRHQAALRHAKIALRYLLQELFGDRAPASEDGEEPKLPSDRVAVWAIAYHNQAVQQEFIRKYDDALVSYEKAVTVCSKYLGDEHEMHLKMLSSLEDARAKLLPKLKEFRKMNVIKRQTMPKGPAAHPQPLHRRELAQLQKSLGIDPKDLDIDSIPDDALPVLQQSASQSAMPLSSRRASALTDHHQAARRSQPELLPPPDESYDETDNEHHLPPQSASQAHLATVRSNGSIQARRSPSPEVHTLSRHASPAPSHAPSHAPSMARASSHAPSQAASHAPSQAASHAPSQAASHAPSAAPPPASHASSPAPSVAPSHAQSTAGSHTPSHATSAAPSAAASHESSTTPPAEDKQDTQTVPESNEAEDRDAE